jgi:hypothetical protein
MAIKKKTQCKTTIDLTGPGGNAFALLGLAESLGRQLEYDIKKRGEINAEMMSGDYENLIKVFDKNFGEYIDLIR